MRICCVLGGHLFGLYVFDVVFVCVCLFVVLWFVIVCFVVVIWGRICCCCVYVCLLLMCVVFVGCGVFGSLVIDVVFACLCLFV